MNQPIFSLLFAAWIGLGLCACETNASPPTTLSTTPHASVSSTPPAPSLSIPQRLSHPVTPPTVIRWIADGGFSGCALAGDADAIYWADAGDAVIRRVSKRDESMKIIADYQGKPSSLWVDDKHLFWLAQATERIRRAPKQGGAFGGLATDITHPLALVIDEHDLYFSRLASQGPGDDGLVLRVSKGGGSSKVLARAQPGMKGAYLAQDADFLYLGHESLLRVPKAGGDVQTLQPSLNYLNALDVDEQNLYLIAGDPPQLFSMPKTGGPMRALHHAVHSPRAFSQNAKELFFSDREGVIRRMSKEGGEVSEAGRIPSAERLFLDETSLWACGDHGLWRLSWAPIEYPPQAYAAHAPATAGFVLEGKNGLIGAQHGGQVLYFDRTTGQSRPLFQLGRSIQFLGAAAVKTTLILGFYNGVIEGWDIRQPKRIWANAPKEGGHLSYLVISPDGRKVLYRRDHETLKQLNTETGADEHAYVEQTGTPSALAISPDNRFWLSGPDRPPRQKGVDPRPVGPKEPALRQWEIGKGKEMAAFAGPAEYLSALVIGTDGKVAITGGDSGKVSAWDLQTQQITAQIQAEGKIHGLAISRSGTRVLVASSGGGLCLWEIGAKQMLACAPHRSRSWFTNSQPVQIIFSEEEDEAYWSSAHGYFRWTLPGPR